MFNGKSYTSVSGTFKENQSYKFSSRSPSTSGGVVAIIVIAIVAVFCLLIIVVIVVSMKFFILAILFQ